MRTDGSGRLGRALAVLAIAALSGPAQAQQTVPGEPPGFRPQSPHAAAFVESCDNARVAVLPTIVRGVDRLTYSMSSQELIMELLAERGLGVPTASELRVELDVPPRPPQWEIYQRSLQYIAAALEEEPSEADYTLVMEILLPPGEEEVFGIETYILDREGQNAFSIILNAYHDAFMAANLTVANDTEEALEATVLAATRLAVSVLEGQVAWVRECDAWMAAHPARRAEAGVIQGFDEGLPTIEDAFANRLGFSTFKGGRSTVYINPTHRHPARAGESPGNRTLRIDLDVKDWAGFAYLPHDATTRTWEPEDWSPFQGFSFWIYGSNSGAELYVHVFDNRNPCSTGDDAERYGYEFTDDFTGWKHMVIPFTEMVRAEIGNDAPNDGLNLTRVHGWAFGATKGTGTWFLDDFALWTNGAG